MADASWLMLHGWTSDEFEKLIEVGVSGAEEKLELIGGELIPKMTQNGPHSTGILCF